MVYTVDLENGFTPAERNALIRYALTVGTRAKCATRSLYRSLKMRDLQAAFREREAGHRKTIEEYRRRAEDYEEGATHLPESLTDFFGGVPTKERFVSYCNDRMEQEREEMRRIRKEYHIAVSYTYTPKTLLRFHRSLSPRVTFGYANVLHEECDFSLTDEVRSAFLRSSLAELPQDAEDWTHDFGYVYFQSVIGLLYEDLAVFRGGRCILETISHERMCTAYLTEEELADFCGFESEKHDNRQILKKIRARAEISEKP